MGSGAAARSIRENVRVMNIDIGGGTSKIALCDGGAVVAQTAVDIGARIVCFDEAGRVLRVEAAGQRLAAEVNLDLRVGHVPDAAGLQRLVECMAEHLFNVVQAGALQTRTAALLRLEPLPGGTVPAVVTFSGGVSEYIYGREVRAFCDLGPALAQAVLQRAQSFFPRIEAPDQGIRATVVGASQYTVQVSGSTIYVEPAGTLPLRNLPVVTPALPLDAEPLNAWAIAASVRAALRRLGLDSGEQTVALCYRWQGSASFARLDAFCRGVAQGLGAGTQGNGPGMPLVLVGDGDIGGLVGIHLRREIKLAQPVISIDGIVLQEFDFIDIGALLDSAGAVPVVIKSLVFPGTAALGRPA